jgi:hypothetical protein
MRRTGSGGTLSVMPTTSKQDQRAARLREFDALIARATASMTVLALIVQGREARETTGDKPLEVTFAAGDSPLPAGLWVALRRDDIETALDLLAGVSETSFVVGEREEMGSGYRLETVEEKRPLPDVDLLRRRLDEMLGIPDDVLRVVAGWGPDDPRTRAEVDVLLDSRFGSANGGSVQADGPNALSMSVAELADVLQLTAGQAKVLATLARRAALTITPDDYDSSQPSGGPIVDASGPNAST